MSIVVVGRVHRFVKAVVARRAIWAVSLVNQRPRILNFRGFQLMLYCDSYFVVLLRLLPSHTLQVFS